MRDAGLCHAIDAAGSLAQLARRIPVVPSSPSNWKRRARNEWSPTKPQAACRADNRVPKFISRLS